MSVSDPIWSTPPPRPRQPPAPPEHPEIKQVDIQIDGQPLRVPETMTILDACRVMEIDTPTLCYLENLTPVNVCRVCVVEVEGSRVLVPACSRAVEPKMVVHTDTERVRLSRRLVLEFLASSVDLSLVSDEVKGQMKRYEARPERFGPKAPPAEDGARDHAYPGHHAPPATGTAATVAQPTKIDNDLYVRDYSK